MNRLERVEIPEYLAELVFDEWAKKTQLGTIKGDKNDADKLIAEAQKVMEKIQIKEEAASSNTGDLKAIDKGKGNRKWW
jgi:hypothetical protein